MNKKMWATHKVERGKKRRDREEERQNIESWQRRQEDFRKAKDGKLQWKETKKKQMQ